MLSVPYFEKALYELPEDQLTPANILKLADDIEVQIQGGLAARPLLSVPHIISDEVGATSSFYFAQTRRRLHSPKLIRWTLSHIFVRAGQLLLPRLRPGRNVGAPNSRTFSEVWTDRGQSGCRRCAL